MERQRAVTQLKALGEPNRLDIFLQLAHGETGGADLLRSSGLSQPSLSRHVRVLREAGVVLERWAGRSAYYRLSDEPLAVGIVEILSRGGPTRTVSRGEKSPDTENMSKYESNDAAPTAAAGEDDSGASQPMEDWLL